MSKSFVTMEQHQCSVCGKTFDTGALLLDQRLMERFDRNTLTGVSLCVDCNEKINDGFNILVVVRDGETGINPYRTGQLIFIKAANPENKLPQPIMYIEETAAKELMDKHNET